MKRAPRRIALLILCATAITSFPALTASAQPATEAQKAEAKQLANEGARHFKEGNFTKAYELFVQADARVHAPTFLIMAARSQERMGALIEARALYEKVAREELGPRASEKFKAAQEEAKRALEAIGPRIPTVQIDLKRAPSNVRVRIDGVEVPRERLSQPVEVNPGTRLIVAAGDGSDNRSVSVTLKEGSREKVELVFPEDTSPPSADLPFEPPAPSSEQRPAGSAPPPSPLAPWSAPLLPPNGAPTPSAGSPVPMIIAFSIGGVGVLTGVVTGAIWMSKDSDIRSQCSGDRCPADLASDIESAKTMGRLAVAGFIVGAAGIGVGTYLVVSSPGPTSTSSGATQVLLGPGSVGVRGSF
jgi:hypothetical protein